MPADRHALHRRLLLRTLTDGCVEPHHETVWAALEECTARWTPGSPMGLLAHMRDVALRASSPVLFGARHGESGELARLAQTYFELRREASAPVDEAGKPPRAQLVAVGTSLDAQLRVHLGECCRSADPSSDGVLGRLAGFGLGPEAAMTQDEIVGHANVLFVSSTEPIAVALTWTLLVLSQLPALRDDLRAEFRPLLEEGVPGARRLARLPLLDRVVAECLRLLPPNAFMVRITTRPASLDGIPLPGRCEVVVCPFLAHRDPTTFPRPAALSPARWTTSSPSPFDYLPFGAGGHSCVGRTLATYLIKTTLVFLLSRFDVLLAGDQDVDWRLHIQFMPRRDPAVALHAVDASPRRAGKLGGPVSALLDLGTV